MVSCLSCDEEIVLLDVEEGETVTCNHCGAEHEVLTVIPPELALMDEDLDEEDALEPGDGDMDAEDEEI